MCPILKINESTKSFVPCCQNQAQTTNIQKTLYGQRTEIVIFIYCYVFTTFLLQFANTLAVIWIAQATQTM